MLTVVELKIFQVGLRGAELGAVNRRLQMNACSFCHLSPLLHSPSSSVVMLISVAYGPGPILVAAATEHR